MNEPSPQHAGGPIALRSRVPAASAGQTLLEYLTSRFRYHDAAQWRAEITAGRVQADERPCTPQLRLRAGAQITYWRWHQEPWADLGFTIVHQDADLVVVDKPAHLPVHGDGPFVQNTLVHRLRERLSEPDLHLVHRLDRETSGICGSSSNWARSARSTAPS
jgi:23S rRNA pseudouridine1911/1915/1917 synthase